MIPGTGSQHAKVAQITPNPKHPSYVHLPGPRPSPAGLYSSLSTTAAAAAAGQHLRHVAAQ
jgi:hypothetical protein